MSSLQTGRSWLRAGAFLLAAVCFANTTLGKDRAAPSLVGSWRLVKYADTPEGGEPVLAFGKEPIGLFIFTADGHISISFMRNPPDISSTSADQDPDTCIPAWYCAYFGTYTVSYERSVWVTRVLGGNIPSYLGTEQPRTFKLDGDTLTISEAYTANGKLFKAERVLKREAAAPSIR
jgi:hypothetical protein